MVGKITLCISVIAGTLVGISGAISQYSSNNSPYKQAPEISPYKQPDMNAQSPYQGSSPAADQARQQQFDARAQAERVETERLQERQRLQSEAEEETEAKAREERSAERRASNKEIIDTITQGLSNAAQGIGQGLQNYQSSKALAGQSRTQSVPSVSVPSPSAPPRFVVGQPQIQVPQTPAINSPSYCRGGMALPFGGGVAPCPEYQTWYNRLPECTDVAAGRASNGSPPPVCTRQASVQQPLPDLSKDKSGYSSPNPNGGGQTGGPSGNGAVCTNMNSAVNFTTSHPTGPGNCVGEVTGRLTNNGSQALDCLFEFYSNGVKKADGGLITIQAGQTRGGEGSGIWSCSADQIRYACFVHQANVAACRVNF